MMKDERKGVSKDNIVKEAKQNEELYSFVKSLTAAEIQRIKSMRDYDAIKPDTPTWKIAILCDDLRQNKRRLMSTVTKRLWTIGDLGNNMDRLNVQLTSGNITEIMKNGLPMNSFELKSLIQHNRWLRDGEFHALFPLLAELRGLVGHLDVARKVIMSQEQYDDYVLSIANSCKSYGYTLFGELE